MKHRKSWGSRAVLAWLATTLTGGGAEPWFWVVWQLISDAGYQGEITSVSTACQQLEVFSRVLRTSLATILDGGEENLEKNLPEFAVSPSESQTTGAWLRSVF